MPRTGFGLLISDFAESCFRMYLYLSPDLKKISDFWEMNEIGVCFDGNAFTESKMQVDGFRAGFCVTKTVTTFNPVWLSNMIMCMLLTPSISMVKQFPIYRRAVRKVQKKLRLQEQSHTETVEAAVLDLEYVVAEFLLNITVGIGFSLWSPILLLFSAALSPLHLLGFQISQELDRKFAAHSQSQRFLYKTFCTQLAGQIKSPTPNKLIGVLAVTILQVSMACTMFDYGFGVSAWCVFFLCIIVQRIIQWRAVNSSMLPEDSSPEHIDFTPMVVDAVQSISFVRGFHGASNTSPGVVNFTCNSKESGCT